MPPIHLIGECYTVEVPEGATGFFFDGRMSIGFYYEGELRFSHLPGPGNWQIICTTKECTEEQGKGIVHSSEWFFPVKHTRYVDYKYPYDRENKQRWSEGFGSALGSFVSLLETKGLNPETNYLIIKKVS
jgi:hypothetical protein